jgi:Flp pilus assembly CpaF family ATPase
LQLGLKKFRRVFRWNFSVDKGVASEARINATVSGYAVLGRVSKIRKAHFRRLNLHILVEKPRRSTTAPAFFASICKPIQ